MKTVTKLGVGLGILALLSPLGLLVPALCGSGAAWGEWSPEEIESRSGFVPKALERLSSFWKALLPDYAFPGRENSGWAWTGAAYVFSAILGIVVCLALVWALGYLLAKKKD